VNSQNPKPERKQVNYFLPDHLIEYVDKWHQATGIPRQDIVAHMIQAYKDANGDPPEPRQMPGIPKSK